MITTSTGLEARRKALLIEPVIEVKKEPFRANVWGSREIIAFDADGDTVAAAGIVRDHAGRWHVWFSARPSAARFSMAITIIGKRWLDRTLTAPHFNEAPVVAMVLDFEKNPGVRIARALGFVAVGWENGFHVFRRFADD
jgi:hypothetical protein